VSASGRDSSDARGMRERGGASSAGLRRRAMSRELPPRVAARSRVGEHEGQVSGPP
jgi:hypothetical protein